MKKKIIVLLSLVLVVCNLFCACGKKNNETQKKDNSIALTLENYQDYLDVVVRCGVSGYGEKKTGYSFLWYDEITSSVDVNGVSPNFMYEDVVVEVLVFGKASAYSWSYSVDDMEISENITVSCNVAGGGSDSVITKLSYPTYESGIEATYEVVSVSGSVVPIN